MDSDRPEHRKKEREKQQGNRAGGLAIFAEARDEWEDFRDVFARQYDIVYSY